MAHRPSIGAGILEPDIVKDEPRADGVRDGLRAGLGYDRGPDVEEQEQIPQIQRLFVDIACLQQQALDDVAALVERCGEKGQRPEANRAGDGAEYDDDERRVVTQGAEHGERRACDPATDRQVAILFVEAVGEDAVAVGQPRRQSEHLDFFGCGIARRDVAQIVEEPPLRRPSEEQRVPERGEMRLADEAREDREDEHEQEDRLERDDRAAERHDGQRVLSHGQYLAEQTDAANGLPSRALQEIVEGRIFELRQVERGGVLHDANADAIREQVAEETLNQNRGARE